MGFIAVAFNPEVVAHFAITSVVVVLSVGLVVLVCVAQQVK